jgi:poly-gamma-glutamate synthesis protein (capsule biosynthesis protein)
MSKSIRIAILGDLFADSGFDVNPDILRIFQTCDAVVANLEGPITNKPFITKDHKIRINMKPEHFHIITDWHITHVTLANNHIFDCGLDGFRDTIDLLKQADISYAGAGENELEAGKPLTIKKNDLTIKIIPATEIRTAATIAQGNSFGCQRLDEEYITLRINEEQINSDFVIVVPHWGFCNFLYPNPDLVLLANKMLDNGADMIVAHHAHCIQGKFSRLDGKIVYFGLGDFFFSYPVTRREKLCPEGMFLILEIEDGRQVKIETYFIFHDQKTVYLDNRQQRQEQLDWISQPLTNTKRYDVFWKLQFRKHMLLRVKYWLYPGNWRKLNIRTLISLYSFLTNKSCFL